jgi:hypothetical protein
MLNAHFATWNQTYMKCCLLDMPNRIHEECLLLIVPNGINPQKIKFFASTIKQFFACQIIVIFNYNIFCTYNKENSLFYAVLKLFSQILVVLKYVVRSDWRIIVQNLEMPCNVKRKTVHQSF